MKIKGIIWLRNIVDKIAIKHHVTTNEVEEVLKHRPIFLFVEKGKRKGENVYMVLGQSNAGRYLTILFIYKKTKDALIISARDMAKKERKYYDKRKA